MREKPKDNTRLRHMLEAINNVIEFTTDVTLRSIPRNKILRFCGHQEFGDYRGGGLFDYQRNFGRNIKRSHGMRS